MNRNPATTLLALLLLAGAVLPSAADETGKTAEVAMHHAMMQPAKDNRISLNLSPQMKAHQLANMRSHLEAMQAISGLMADGKFDEASQIAHAKLGLTEEMKTMCAMFENESFRSIGMAFHKSGDALGDALKAKDTEASLRAMGATLAYCVQCHATFRQ